MDLPGRLVLLGHPVADSLSPLFQNAALRSAGIPLEYEAIDVLPSGLVTMAALLREADGAGNVTIPHKETFFALCTGHSPVAERVGAVNTFWVEGGALVGDNTDVGGFDAAFRTHFGAPRPGMEVAVIGAGGAASAVLAAVERWDGGRVRLVARNRARASALVARYDHIARLVADERASFAGVGLVVNTTPLGGLSADLPVEPGWLDDACDVLDLNYRRTDTPWVLACRARGLRAADGLSMLVEQGALSFERWFGATPDRTAMWKAVGR